MDITSSYHLPTDAYWHCSDRYNGISRLERFNTSFPLFLIKPKQLGNTKISRSIANRLQ